MCSSNRSNQFEFVPECLWSCPTISSTRQLICSNILSPRHVLDLVRVIWLVNPRQAPGSLGIINEGRTAEGTTEHAEHSRSASSPYWTPFSLGLLTQYVELTSYHEVSSSSHSHWILHLSSLNVLFTYASRLFSYSYTIYFHFSLRDFQSYRKEKS